MPYLTELSELVQLHARAQGLNRTVCRDVLARVDRVEGNDQGSWCAEWVREADRMSRDGRYLDACRTYGLARFPYPAEPCQRHASRLCVASFDRWRRHRGGIVRLKPNLLGQQVPVWVSGLDPGEPRPLLLIIGGIVSPKEQWAPLLPAARRLGMAAVVTEMPGVGENPLTYSRESWRMLADLVDALSELAPVSDVYAVAMSFGGHLALRYAANDQRLDGLVTVGAPVAAFFQDAAWWPHVPQTTKRTLGHLTGAPADEVHATVRDFALQPDELARVTVPVHYVVSSRDEIIPPEEPRLLARRLPTFRSIEFDDVHGSPSHVLDTKLWILRSLLRMREGPPPRLAALDAVLRFRQITRGLSKGRL